MYNCTMHFLLQKVIPSESQDLLAVRHWIFSYSYYTYCLLLLVASLYQVYKAMIIEGTPMPSPTPIDILSPIERLVEEVAELEVGAEVADRIEDEAVARIVDVTSSVEVAVGTATAGCVGEPARVELVARLPLTKTTSTAAYAAVAAKTSCLRALVKSARDPANATVRPLNMPSFAFGLVTQ
jgi:hypothetical protein